MFEPFGLVTKLGIYLLLGSGGKVGCLVRVCRMSLVLSKL